MHCISARVATARVAATPPRRQAARGPASRHAVGRIGLAVRTSAVSMISAEAAAKQQCPIPPPAHPSYDIEKVIQLALDEDSGDIGDITSLATMAPETQGVAYFLAKADGVLAGVAVANMVFALVDPSLEVEWVLGDGDLVTRGTRIGEVRGSALALLRAERVALNFMQRMSGVATATRQMAEAAKPARILETRKTVPGLRLFDKWAVLIGGGENHRMGLFDMLMIKDNHVAAAGGITAAVNNSCEYLAARELSLPIELETRTLEEVKEAIQVIDSMASDASSRVVRIMLDNMSLEEMVEAVELIGDRCDTEASGNVTMETVHNIGQTGVTFISSGALTHSVMALDISMNIES